MWNKQKQLVALTAVAGLLTVPVASAIAQSASPFGKGNPIQSLSEQIDRLERRVSRLEDPGPLIPSGLYEQSTDSYCIQADELDDNFTVPQGKSAIVYRVAGIATVRYQSDGSAASGTVTTEKDSYVSVAPTSVGAFGKNVDLCPPSRYTMSSDADGAFTVERGSCAWSVPGGTRINKGTIRLYGRVLDGGKMYILTSITRDKESIWPPGYTGDLPKFDQVCIRNMVGTRISK